MLSNGAGLQLINKKRPKFSENRMQHLIVGLLLSGLVGYGVGTSDCSRPPRGTGPEWWLKCALQLGLDECDGKSMYTHPN